MDAATYMIRRVGRVREVEIKNAKQRSALAGMGF
jgi:hypothetical protein